MHLKYKWMLPKVSKVQMYQLMLPNVSKVSMYKQMLPKVSKVSMYKQMPPNVSKVSMYNQMLPKVLPIDGPRPIYGSGLIGSPWAHRYPQMGTSLKWTWAHVLAQAHLIYLGS